MLFNTSSPMFLSPRQMEVIQEEDESHAAKMSPMLQANYLGFGSSSEQRFDFVNLDPVMWPSSSQKKQQSYYDFDIMRGTYSKLKQQVDTRSISRVDALHNYEDLRVLIDNFFVSHAANLNESESESLSELCQRVNLLHEAITDELLSQSNIILEKTNPQRVTTIIESTNVEESNSQTFKPVSHNAVAAKSSVVEHEEDLHKQTPREFESTDGTYSVPNELKMEPVNRPKSIQVKDNPFTAFSSAGNAALLCPAKKNAIGGSVVTTATAETSVGGITDPGDKNTAIKSSHLSFTDSTQKNDVKLDTAAIAGETLGKIINLSNGNLVDTNEQKCQNDLKKDAQLPVISEVENISNSDRNKPEMNNQIETATAASAAAAAQNAMEMKAEQERLEKVEREGIKKGLEKDMQQIRELFHEKLLDDVEVVLLRMESLRGTHGGKYDGMISEFLASNQKELDYYKELCKELANCVNLLGQKEGWKMEKESAGFSIQYKMMEGTKMIALRVESSNLAIELKTLVAILYEIELYTKWMPFCKHGQNLKTIDRACKVVHLNTSPPFISDRELFVHGMGVDRLSHDGCIYIMGRSIDKDAKFLNEIGITLPPQGKNVRVDIPFLTFSIKPQADKKITLSLLANFDAHLKFVPDSVINLVVRKFAKFMITKMLEQQKKYKGSEWERNVNNNPAFYNWIDEKVTTYLDNLKNPITQNKNNNKNTTNTLHL